MRSLVHGLAITGVATVRALQRHGHSVSVTDDSPDETRERAASELGLRLEQLPDDLDRFVSGFDLVSPAPGVPEGHPLIEAALRNRVRIASEIELAYESEQARAGGPRPMLAVTGTDGKTTTCEMAVAILTAAGHRTCAVGNTDVPLLDALDHDLDLYVVECTSFRLAWTEQFRADAAVWLNLAPDHLNWHRDMDSYESAKARIFAGQRSSDVSIGNVADAAVRRHLDRSVGIRRSFGTGGDYYEADGWLVGPRGPIVETAVMSRRLPHDIENALAACALVLETGQAEPRHVEMALSGFRAPAHRLEWVASVAGIDFYDDSKATTPHAAVAAIRAFPTGVLIAGGRNKDLDLTPMGEAGSSLRAVVAIGEAADEIEAAFGGRAEVVRAGSMETAVEMASRLAQPGDAVVLSPGCASFDWYPSGGYPARGDHFARAVRALEQMGAAQGTTGGVA
jgi:UDP-N-acetylmuramoylalanine--D-glutamate ligase